VKILHTADWHIGKVLHKHPLREELTLFFDWLFEIIQKEKIDVLLVSGDIFDLANPAVLDRELYYQFLSRLISLKIQIIITGGNHDAVGLLNAPKEILKSLNISVVGGAKDNIEEEIITISNSKGETQLIIAAVPFLRDKDLRNRDTDSQFENRTEAIRAGIKKHYQDLGEICAKKYAGIPAIAMGHLYAKGALTSESERDIHVGNAAAVESNIFPENYNYVALGHIHRPQVIGKNEFIRYSGSPIALSFSEKKDIKSIIVIELKNGKIQSPIVIEVPKFRTLKKISGDIGKVKMELNDFKSESPLCSFIELEIQEEQYSPLILAAVDSLVNAYQDNPSLQILKNKTVFKEGAKDTADLFNAGENIEDLKPKEVFAKMLEVSSANQDKHKILMEAFMELVEASQTDAL